VPNASQRFWRGFRRSRKGQAQSEDPPVPRVANTRDPDFRSYRTPVQVCSRGCEYTELARRDLIIRSKRSGRAVTEVSWAFETSNCPKCGAGLLRECARCHRQILPPVADRCRFCGLPHPWAAERRGGRESAALRKWKPDEGVNDPARHLYEHLQQGDIWVIEGDITQMAVDAVISNDDVDGRMWTEVARAIKRAAGEDVERLAKTGAPFVLGQAWLTAPGDMRIKAIIHVAAMNRRGESNIDDTRKCLDAALDLAAKRGFESVGVAAIGSGPAAIEPERWLDEFVSAAVLHLSGAMWPRKRPQPLSIVLVLFEPNNFEETVRRIRGKVEDAWFEVGKPEGGGRPVPDPEPPADAQPMNRPPWWARFRRRAAALASARIPRALRARRETPADIPDRGEAAARGRADP
jgi:O-acetyl-ADP-ribose deacetylase (regulator of RNase III)